MDPMNDDPPVEAGPASRKGTRLLTVGAVVAFLAVGVWWCSQGGESPEPQPQEEEEEAAPEERVAPAVEFQITASVDDRLFHEPCNVIPSGGLHSFNALHDENRKHIAICGLSFGNVTQVRGELGRRLAVFLYEEVFNLSGPMVIVAGEGELGLGVAFAREFLSSLRAGDQSVHMLCANAQDPQGNAILRGWTIANVKGHVALVVGSASDSLNAELAACGSDVVVAPPAEAVRAALAAGMAKAADLGSPVDSTVLMHHGTVEETAALVREVPGFTFAAAGRGGVLADIDPQFVGEVPVYYPGRGGRFAWRVLVSDVAEDRVQQRLARLGRRLLLDGSPLQPVIRDFHEKLAPMLLAELRGDGNRAPHPGGRFVGSGSCVECHAKQAQEHALSGHAKRRDGKFASPACFSCHATGAAFDSGWWGVGDPRDLGSVSCEACHGPAEAHVAAPDAPGYGAVSLASCVRCHLPERSPTFDPAEWWKLAGHGAKPKPPEPVLPKHSGPVPAPKDGGDDKQPPKDGGDDKQPPKDGGDDTQPPKDGGDDKQPPKDGGDDTQPPKDGGGK